MATNKNAMEVYKKIISKYKTMKVCIIFSEVDNAPVAYSSPEIMKLLRDNKKHLYLKIWQILRYMIYQLIFNVIIRKL